MGSEDRVCYIETVNAAFSQQSGTRGRMGHERLAKTYPYASLGIPYIEKMGNDANARESTTRHRPEFPVGT